MIDYQPFLSVLQQYGAEHQGIARWQQALPQQIDEGLDESRYGDLPRWRAVLQQLPPWPVTAVDLNSAAVTISGQQPETQLANFRELLKGLHPWRKGPFQFFEAKIDTEWRSDWKWDRLREQISPLSGRTVLDIGCGSGYHCWRMRGAGAELVVGIDPTPLFVCQFFAAQYYINDPRVTVLPLGIEQLPDKLHFFDTVFSMGVLYHRRSPFDHLIELRETLRPGGELVLETLVVDGDNTTVLVPEGRYAKMGNVWFLPSCKMLSSWLKKAGFADIKLVDLTTTTTAEQRSTEWMTFHSLQQFLDPADHSKTIEGYSAPQRAVFTATRAR